MITTWLLNPRRAMAEQSSSVSGDTDTAGTASTAHGWAPQGRTLTACVVVFNVAIVLLLYLYFWRMFSRKRVGDDESDDEDGASSSASSVPPAAASPRTRDLVASLPVFVVVHTDAAAATGEECAVCIAELRDGDEGRALPRCGHRFHAACVDAWLRLHTTCPLCRASVVVVAEAEAELSKGGVQAETTADVEDMDAIVV